MASYRTSGAGGGTSGSTDRTCAILSAVNDFIIVFAATSGNTNTAPTCSDGSGGTYSLVGTAQWGAGANTLSVFVANQLVAGAGTTTVTVATGANTAGAVVMVAYQGMRLLGLGAVRQFAVQQNQAAGATPAPAFTNNALTISPTLGCIANTSNPATMTTPSGWTERQDTGQATPNTGNEVVTRDSGFTGTTVTWGSTSGSTWASFILELESTIPHEDDVVPVPVLVTPTTTIAGMSVVEEILAAAAASALEEDIARTTAPIMTTLAPTWFTVDEFVATAAASAGLDELAPLVATIPFAAGLPSLLSIDEATIVISETAVVMPLPAPAPPPPQLVLVTDEQAAAAQAWDDELGVVAIVRPPVIQPPLVLVPDEQPTAAQATDEEIGFSAMAAPQPAQALAFPPADEFAPSTTPDDELGLSVMPPRAADLVQLATSIDEPGPVTVDEGVTIAVPPAPVTPIQLVLVTDEQAAAAQAWDDELGVVAIVRPPVIQPPLVLVPDEQPTAAQVTDEEIGPPASPPLSVPPALAAPPVDECAASVPDEELGATPAPPAALAPPPTFPSADEFAPSTTPDDELGLSVMPPRAADLVQLATSIDEPGPVTVDEGVTIAVPPAPVTPIQLVLVTDEQAAAAQAWDDELGVVAIVRPPVIQPPLVLVPDEQPTAAQVVDDEWAAPASVIASATPMITTLVADESTVTIDDEWAAVASVVAGGGSPPAALTVDETSPASITEDAPTPTPYAVAIVTLTPTVTDEEVGASVDEYSASWAAPIIVDVAACAIPEIVENIVSVVEDDAPWLSPLVAPTPWVVWLPVDEPTVSVVTETAATVPAWMAPLPTFAYAAVLDEEAALSVAALDEEGAQAASLVVTLAYCPPALPIDEFSGFVVPPPPPPRPTPTFTGGGGGGGYYVTRFSDYVIDDDGNVLMDEPSPERRHDDDVSELEHAEQAVLPAAMGDAPMSVPTFVIDLLGPGALSFGTTKRITTFATGKWGKKGGAAAAVGSAVATFLATKKAGKVRLPLVAGSSIASLETLYHLYVSESKRTTPPTRASMTAFRAAVASQHAPVSAQARQVLMRGKSGRSYPVLVVQYTADIYGGTWFAQEARKMAADGSVDLRGTLLDELTPKR